MRRTATLAVALILAGAAHAAEEPVAVEIPDGGLTLKATLYRPDGLGPFPAVIALHAPPLTQVLRGNSVDALLLCTLTITLAYLSYLAMAVLPKTMKTATRP